MNELNRETKVRDSVHEIDLNLHLRLADKDGNVRWEVARKPNQYWHLPMNLTLSLGLRYPHIGWVGQEMKSVPQAATAEGFPTSMEVDYVRVWERK